MSKKEYSEVGRKKAKAVKAGPNAMSRKLAAFWKDQIETVDSSHSAWYKRGDSIVKRYRDDRSKQDRDGQRRMNLLWTNIQIMRPAIYSKMPTIIIDRKFLDKDETGRLSSQILERGLRNECSFNGFHKTIKQVLTDYLLVGRGTVWARYEPEIGNSSSIPSQTSTSLEDELGEILDEDTSDESSEEEQLEDSGDQVISEKVLLDYVDWHDFYTFPAKARTWAEVQAVGKAIYMSKEECEDFFGKDIGEDLVPDNPNVSKYQSSPYSDMNILEDINKRDIKIFEIWNKTDLRVYWACSGYEYLCKVEDDPLKLTRFFPCPQPLYANMTNNTLIPVPDYMEWQDQALQIDELTQRIAMLTKACKVAGTYDAGNGALKRLLSESCENELIPVDSWAAYSEKGGIQGSISFLPLKEIQEVIETLTSVRREVKQDLDEVTGLSDVLRGTSDSRETLGGLRIKNNNAGSRLNDRQDVVIEFCKEAIVILSEIMAKHFSEESLIEASGIKYDEELDPDNVLDEIMMSDSAKKMLSPPTPPPMLAQPPQQAMPNPQMPNTPPAPPGSNVVPFNQGAQPLPQQPQQPMPPPPPPTEDEVRERLKPLVPELIAQKIKSAIELLRKDVPRRYRIDVETDSTILADAMQERDDTVQFITAISGFLKQAMEAGTQMPQAVPLFGRILEFGVRKFRTGRDLESAISTFVKQSILIAKKIEENPPPDPEQQKVDAQIKLVEKQSEAQSQNDQRDYARQQAEDQRNAQIAAADDQRKSQLEDQKAKAQERITILQANLEELRIKRELEQMDREAAYKEAEHRQKMEQLKFTSNMKSKKEAHG